MLLLHFGTQGLELKLMKGVAEGSSRAKPQAAHGHIFCRTWTPMLAPCCANSDAMDHPHVDPHHRNASVHGHGSFNSC